MRSRGLIPTLNTWFASSARGTSSWASSATALPRALAHGPHGRWRASSSAVSSRARRASPNRILRSIGKRCASWASSRRRRCTSATVGTMNWRVRSEQAFARFARRGLVGPCGHPQLPCSVDMRGTPSSLVLRMANPCGDDRQGSPDRARRRWGSARLSAHPVNRRDPSGQRLTTPSQRGPVIGTGFGSLNTSELGAIWMKEGGSDSLRSSSNGGPPKPWRRRKTRLYECRSGPPEGGHYGRR